MPDNPRFHRRLARRLSSEDPFENDWRTRHLEHPDVHRPWSRWSESETLHVAIPYSNPFRWETRRLLLNHCVRRLRQMPNVAVHVGELAYGDRPFEVTGEDPNDVQLRTAHELFHKENIANAIIRRFPAGWKYGAVCDGDFEFTRHDWALETIHMLQHHDFVQPFSSYADLSGDAAYGGMRPTRLNASFAANYVNSGCQLPSGWENGGWKVPPGETDCYGGAAMGLEAGKPAKWVGVGATGGCWAFRRSAFDVVGGMLDQCILGHGDWFMTFGLVSEPAPDMRTSAYSPGYQRAISSWQRNAARLRKNIGFVDCFAIHHFHGSKMRRGYSTRDQILVQYQFDPLTDLRPDYQGIYQLTEDKPGLRDAIRLYFTSRCEDDPTLHSSEKPLV